MSKPAVLSEPVLVGREKEFQELQSFLNSAVEGKGRTVFVSGEAGSGKTRLTREFLKAAKEKGAGVMAGWCLSEAEVPYFPFIEAFNSYFSSLVEEEQRKILPQPSEQFAIGIASRVSVKDRGITAWLTGTKPAEKAGQAEALSAHVWKDQVFVGVAQTLHAIAAQSPVILLIEDIHWADSASLALLHYIARVIHDSEKVLILATYRKEELLSDIEGRPHPLAETMRMMRREELLAEIELPRLDKGNVSRIAENMIGGSLQPGLAEKLTNESKGNPLFIVESLRMLHERGSLVKENDLWRLAVDELAIPSKIRDIIMRRLTCLKYAQRRVLDAASVIGEEFDVDLLSNVLGLDSLDVLETLNMVAHSTSLVRVEESHYRFDHARSRETLYEELALPLKKGYHLRIAEKLESTKGAAPPLSDLAYHYVQAGDIEKAVKYALAAGKDELAKWSNAEAIRHFNYVIGAIGADPKCADEKESALGGLADALYAVSLYKEAERTFEQLARTTQKDAVKLRALRMAIFSAFSLGDRSKLAELLKKAEQYAPSDRLENAKLLMLKSRLFTVQHDWSASIECTEAALQVFEEEYSLGDVAICLMSIGSQRVAGELDGLAESLRAVALFEELRSFSQQMIACYLAGGAFGNCLLWPEALNMYAKIVEINAKTKVGNYPALAYSYAFSSQISECLGEVEKALAYSLKALEISNKTDTLVNQGQAFSNLTVQYARLGDMKSAEEYFGKLMKLPSEIRSHFFVPVPIAKAALAAAKEQWKEASQCFTEFFEPLEKSQGNYFFKSRAKLLYAWALEKQGRFEDAKLQIEEVQKMRQGAEERFEHANLQAHLMVCNHVVASEEFEMRLDLVNVSRKPGFLVKAEDLIPAEFEVTTSPSQSIVLKGSVGMKNRVVNPFQVETLKLKIKASKPGTFTLNPQVSYIDELGETNTYKTNPITITVQPAKPKYELLPGRVSTGSEELDGLLLGGIPEKHALVLTSPSIDERELLIKRFVEAGAKADEIVFDIAQENGTAKALVEEYPSNFYLFICNPQAEEMFQASLNVFKLKGVENLTDIDIALTKAFRMLKPAETGPKRICIEIISDALLQHHAVNTRRWLSALLTTLKLKGFTILAVVDPSMHPAEELQAILGVFDGEIRVTEKETPEGTKRTLKIRKLINQKYSDKEIILNKEALSD